MESQSKTNEHQNSTNERQAVKNALSEHKIYDLEREIRELRDRDIADLRHQLEALANERNNALKYGIILLGSTVVGLVGWIINYFKDHVR